MSPTPSVLAMGLVMRLIYTMGALPLQNEWHNKTVETLLLYSMIMYNFYPLKTSRQRLRNRQTDAFRFPVWTQDGATDWSKYETSEHPFHSPLFAEYPDHHQSKLQANSYYSTHINTKKCATVLYEGNLKCALTQWRRRLYVYAPKKLRY